MFSCCICLERYSAFQRNRHPVHSLTCVHSICVDCLANIRRSRQSSRNCPICRAKHAFGTNESQSSSKFVVSQLTLDLLKENAMLSRKIREQEQTLDTVLFEKALRLDDATEKSALNANHKKYMKRSTSQAKASTEISAPSLSSSTLKGMKAAPKSNSSVTETKTVQQCQHNGQYEASLPGESVEMPQSFQGNLGSCTFESSLTDAFQIGVASEMTRRRMPRNRRCKVMNTTQDRPLFVFGTIPWGFSPEMLASSSNMKVLPEPLDFGSSNAGFELGTAPSIGSRFKRRGARKTR